MNPKDVFALVIIGLAALFAVVSYIVSLYGTQQNNTIAQQPTGGH